MLARSIKHMVYDLLKDRSDLRGAAGPTIVACINAILGSMSPAEAGASPEQSKRDPPSATSPNSSAAASSSKSSNNKGKSRQKKNHHATTNGSSSSSSAAALQPQKTLSPPPVIEHSLEELRELVVVDIRKRYRYAINFTTAAPSAEPVFSVPNPLALLRRICQKLGLRVASRAYDFTAREPLTVNDVIDVQPVAKHSTPTVILEEAKDMVDSGKLLAQAGNVGLAFEYLNVSMYLVLSFLSCLEVLMKIWSDHSSVVVLCIFIYRRLPLCINKLLDLFM